MLVAFSHGIKTERKRPSLKKKKKLQAINAGEYMEKREPSCTVGENVK